MHRFYAPDIASTSKTAELDGSETRHLRDVLRVRAGEQVLVFDGKGSEFKCDIVEVRRDRTELSVSEQVPPSSPESGLDLTLAAALTKGDKFELVIQKSVELGVNAIMPMITKRCDVQASSASNRVKRWRRIALDAAKQSGRARLMEIHDVVDFPDIIRGAAKRPPGGRILFSEWRGESFNTVDGESDMLAAIGPEGGWEEAELDAAMNSGFRVVTLGGRILRAETAAIALAAILQHRFGDLN